MIQTKIISSLEKCFLDQTPNDFNELDTLKFYKNSGASFQLALYDDGADGKISEFYKISVEGTLAPYVNMRSVESVPNYLPLPTFVSEEKAIEDGHLRVKPGLYPDVLVPLLHNESVSVMTNLLHSVWFDISAEHEIAAGDYELNIELTDKEGKVVKENNIKLCVIAASLPEADTKVTQWFHADCLADYYDVEVFSDRHFEICQNFIKCAAKNGINMIFVPVFTPPLDTTVGGERTTTQLVGVTVENGIYSFDFSLVERWLNMCTECGMKYFEISHLFTQWGAYHAPKIIARVNGETKQIFGWDTDANSDEYISFLNQFLTEFTAFLSSNGYKDNIYFHISDEPNEEQLPQYKRSKSHVREALKGWKQFDALSEVTFFKQGLCDIPVPSVGHIKPFLEEDIPERWIYYCWEPCIGSSNRLMTMHSARTRFFGIQMYKYGIEGFLHWGYNFYNDFGSDDCINPFLNTNGGYWSVSGDCFSVYPGHKGTALESLRLIAFKQGLDDIRLLKLCEKYYSKEHIIEEIETICGTITFDKCVNDTAAMQKIKSCLDEMIIKAL